MALTEDIIQELEALKERIRQNMETAGENASHRTEQSFAVEVYDGGVRLVARAGERAPLDTLEIGRPAGKVPSGFTAILEQWSRDKGIQMSDKDRRTFAYFLGKRIQKEGTKRNAQHEDIYSSAVEESAKKIEQIILARVTEMIKTNK